MIVYVRYNTGTLHGGYLPCITILKRMHVQKSTPSFGSRTCFSGCPENSQYTPEIYLTWNLLKRSPQKRKKSLWKPIIFRFPCGNFRGCNLFGQGTISHQARCNFLKWKDVRPCQRWHRVVFGFAHHILRR